MLTDTGAGPLRLLASVASSMAKGVEAGSVDVWDDYSDDIEQALGLLLGIVEASEELPQLKRDLQASMGLNFASGWKVVSGYVK